MPYRDEQLVLKSRRDDIAQRLQFLTERASELDAIRSERPKLEREIADLDARLRKLSTQRSLPVLERMHIAAPCNAAWDQMQGDDRVRFCGQCEKNVYNLSEMTRADAESLIATTEGNACVRYYKRADGTVRTTDCAVGVSKRRRRRVLAVVGASAVAGAALVAVQASTRSTSVHGNVGDPGAQMLQGQVAIVRPPSPPPPQHVDPAADPNPHPRVRPLMGRPSFHRAENDGWQPTDTRHTR